MEVSVADGFEEKGGYDIKRYAPAAVARKTPVTSPKLTPLSSLCPRGDVCRGALL